MTNDHDNPEQLPQGLIDRLKAEDEHASLITARVDREVMRLAETQFAGRRRKSISVPAWTAVAATALLVVAFTLIQDPEPLPERAIYSDIDESGNIDIADVLLLARGRAGEQYSQAEIDAFAMRIVSLAPDGDQS